MLISNIKEVGLNRRFELAIRTSRYVPDFLQLKSILDQGANINGEMNMGFPLRNACTNVSLSMVKFLVENGADVNCAMSSEIAEKPGSKFWVTGSTILHWAAYVARTRGGKDIQVEDCARIMLELIASGANPNAKDSKGNTPSCSLDVRSPIIYFQALALPLHSAIKLQEPQLCVRLLERGINGDEKNSAKQTAWRFAELKSPQCLAAMQSWQAMRAINDCIASSLPAIKTI